MGGLSIINGKLINGLMATYSDRFLHLRALSGGKVRVWVVADVDDIACLTNIGLSSLPLVITRNSRHTITESFPE